MTQTTTSLNANPWTTRTARIAEIVPEFPDVVTYRLIVEGPPGASDCAFIPGQFNMLYLPGVGESAISMSGDPDMKGAWIHTVRVAGNVTHSLAQLRPSETLGVRGPFGTGWPIDEIIDHDVVIVAGGLGMAPLRPLVYHIMNHRNQFGNVWLIYGGRTPDTLLYVKEHVTWRNCGIDVQLTVDRGTADWTSDIGVVTLLIDRLQLPNPHRTHLLACGPEVMMKYSMASGLRQGIAAERMWLSMERNMQCAVGHCGHCQLGPEFICKDGPVLRYDRLRPYLFVEQL